MVIVSNDFLKTILFTMDEEILEAMAQYDQTYDGDEEDEDELLRSCYFERPSTVDLGEEGVSRTSHLKLSFGILTLYLEKVDATVTLVARCPWK